MSFFAKNIGKRWFYILSAILLGVAAIQSILYLTCYEEALGLYKFGFPSGVVAVGYLLVAFVTLSGVIYLPLYAIKKSAPKCLEIVISPKPTRALDFVSLLTAASIAATLVTQLIRLNADDPLSILLSNVSDTNTTARTMLVLSLVLAIPAAVYFVGFFAQKTWPYALLFTIVWLCVYMLRVYFDTSILLMSPIRMMTLAALSAALFFLLMELRLARGIHCPILYSVGATLTALFSGVSGFTALLLTVCGRLPLSTESVYYAFQLLLALFALLRMKEILTPIFAAFDACKSKQREDE